MVTKSKRAVLSLVLSTLVIGFFLLKGVSSPIPYYDKSPFSAGVSHKVPQSPPAPSLPKYTEVVASESPPKTELKAEPEVKPETKTKPAAPSQDADEGEEELVYVYPQQDDPTLSPIIDPIPRRNFTDFAHYPPQNIKDTSGNAYATFYCSRRAHVQDPFFAATQSIVWRILWSNWRSNYPIIIFVCPFTPEEHRVMLRGQGAIVKEVELLDNIVPVENLLVGRWQDQFSKLNFWKETEYKKIVYLDNDAFPIANIDDVFDLVQEQDCKEDLLSEDDKALLKTETGKSLCRYAFGGVDPYGYGEINGGFLVFSPSMAMHTKLLREARKTEQFDIEKMEQGLLHSKLAFGEDGPFPAQYLPQHYNVAPEHYKNNKGDGPLEESGFRVIHNKLWSTISLMDRLELKTMWDLDWLSLCRYYDDEPYEYARTTGRFKSGLEVLSENLEKMKLEEDLREQRKKGKGPSRKTQA